MSTNLIILRGPGDNDECPVWPTPTDVSFAICTKPNNTERVQAYYAWVRETAQKYPTIYPQQAEQHIAEVAAWIGDDVDEVDFTYE